MNQLIDLRFIKSLVIVATLLLFNSCGLMFGGSKYNGLIIVKDHPDAQITIDGVDKGKGKYLGTFNRNEVINVQVKEEGCEQITRPFRQVLRTGNFILSFLTWGIVGIGIDVATGAAFKPDHIHDPSIKKAGYKSYIFTVDYPACPKQ